MSPVVFDTKDVDITNPNCQKSWPWARSMNCYRNLINCRDNEHYEQVEMKISDNNFNSISKQLLLVTDSVLNHIY